MFKYIPLLPRFVVEFSEKKKNKFIGLILMNRRKIFYTLMSEDIYREQIKKNILIRSEIRPANERVT